MGQSLVGQTKSTFSRINTIVRESLERSLTKYGIVWYHLQIVKPMIHWITCVNIKSQSMCTLIAIFKWPIDCLLYLAVVSLPALRSSHSLTHTCGSELVRSYYYKYITSSCRLSKHPLTYLPTAFCRPIAALTYCATCWQPRQRAARTPSHSAASTVWI